MNHFIVNHQSCLNSKEKGPTVYILIQEEEQELKSEKFVQRALRNKLVEFDCYIIYHIYIKEHKQRIRVKDL